MYSIRLSILVFSLKSSRPFPPANHLDGIIREIAAGDIFFADFNLNKDNRRKLIDIGYKQTIEYFKNVLPKKKQKHQVQILKSWKEDLKSVFCQTKSNYHKHKVP